MMSLKTPNYYFWFLIALLAFIGQACGVTQKPIPATPTAIFSVTETPSPSVELYTTSPSIISTATLLPTLTAEPVTVVALKGDLFIRRGPDLAFNPISVLKDGQSATALSRDVLGDWLQIPLPDQPSVSGWISIQSHFTVVNGDVMSLPEFNQTDWPVAASLRNCTHHQMEADPAGIILPPVDNFPDNEVRINPGTYIIHDIDMDGNPSVLKVVLKEGSAVDVRTDGTGERRKCPIP
jgi:hypothetical protein